jgi:hypothetical protein
MVLGGITACSDHNPTVVFTVDAAAGKSDAGTSQDGGGSHDGGTAAEVAVAPDGGGPLADVPTGGDLPPDADRISDVASLPDVGVADVGADRALDSNQASDSATAIDSSRTGTDSPGPAVDGSGGSTLDVGGDSSAAPDGGGAGG